MEKVYRAEQRKEIAGEPRKDHQGVLETLTRAAGRSPVFRALLLSTGLASLEGCASKFGIGTSGPLEHVEAEDHPPIKGEKLPSYEKMLEVLNTAIGEEYVQNALEVQQRYAVANEQREKGKTVFLGFENLDISKGEVRQLFTETIPLSWWGNGHVGKVIINPHFQEMPYPGREGEPEYAHCQPFTDGQPIEIEFNHESLKENQALQSADIRALFSSTLHELAHASDWGTAASLQPEQTLTLMYLTHQAATNPGRPRFKYPESIHNKDSKGKQKETAQKMTEFFAVMMETALEERGGKSWASWEEALEKKLETEQKATPQGARQAIRLARTHLAWTAPGFSPWEAAEARNALVEKISTHHEFRRLEKLLLLHIQDKEVGKRLAHALKNATISEEDAKLQIYLLFQQDETKDQHLKKDRTPLAPELPASQNEMLAFNSLNSLMYATLVIRANELGFRNRSDALFLANITDKTIEEFNDAYRRLTQKERMELRWIFLRRLEIIEGKYPARH